MLFKSTPKLDILKIKTGTRRPVTPVERRPLLRTISYSKGSGFGASFLDEAGSSLPKQGVVHKRIVILK